jgi:3-hydroxyisobutyrate dehydrogenase-like beta-hydroxyacid dehydrogenase
MGSAVGAAARAGGARVLWASEGRSAKSRAQAEAAGLEDARTLAALVASSEVILSVVPPHAALDVARDVMRHGFARIYVDANAIAPASARAVGAIVENGGARFVDGGIVGDPPRAGSRSRLYLSGPEAEGVASLFTGTPLETVVLDAPAGAASALKMAYAAWTKGTSALVLAIRTLAAREGVEEPLRREWQASQPDLVARLDRAARSTRKAWRWVGEMEEIATSFEAAGLPDGFHLAAAEIFRALARYKDVDAPPSLDEITAALAGVAGRAEVARRRCR